MLSLLNLLIVILLFLIICSFAKKNMRSMRADAIQFVNANHQRVENASRQEVERDTLGVAVSEEK